MEVLRDGGNAVDAAVAMAAVLAVVYPQMAAIGGDNFWLIYNAGTKQLRGLNASGRSGEKATIQFYQAHGHADAIPSRGYLSANTVPGAVSGWDAAYHHAEMSMGRHLPWARLLRPSIELAENVGIIFVDEMDKVVASEGGRGADVSRQGVQRDLLPIVEGTTVNTRYGPVRTDHILFIAAGAFHLSKPSDLMPELQGRFPIHVELTDLKREDFLRILTEPKHALTKQYEKLMEMEGVELEFSQEALRELAGLALKKGTGARALRSLLEKLMLDVHHKGKAVVSAGTRETMERDAEILHGYGLWATVSHDR